MRLPNGFGSCHKIGGSKQRRRPWRARVTVGWEFDESKGKAVQRFHVLGYFATKKEALQALAEHNKNPIAPESARATFADVWGMWKSRNEQRMTAKVLSAYKASFNSSAPLHGRKIADIRTEDMQAVMNAYPSGQGAQIRLRSLWRQLFRFALEHDLVRKDYAEFVMLKDSKPAESKRKPFTKEQIAALWENVDLVKSADAILMMIFLGVRPSEFLDIQVDHVHLSERWIDLYGTKTDAARRIVPIHKSIVPLVERRLSASVSGRLFEDDLGPVVYMRFLRTHWRPAMDALGFDGLSPHCARHTFATLMVDAGADDRLLKRIIGHASGTVTEKYTHAYVESLIREIDKIGATCV